MATNPKHSMLLTGALVALAAVASFPVARAESNAAYVTSDEAIAPLIVAEARNPTMGGNSGVAPTAAYPAYQRGVRQAASEGPEALRRYIWRTRMIYDYYFPDFVED